jgi:hypothetical protein
LLEGKQKLSLGELIYHGFYPFLDHDISVFIESFGYFRVYIESLQVQVQLKINWRFGCILELNGMKSRSDEVKTGITRKVSIDTM